MKKKDLNYIEAMVLFNKDKVESLNKLLPLAIQEYCLSLNSYFNSNLTSQYKTGYRTCLQLGFMTIKSRMHHQ